jgi:hypothetical protein
MLFTHLSTYASSMCETCLMTSLFFRQIDLDYEGSQKP